jgi:amidophosphoribosyltransferase
VGDSDVKEACGVFGVFAPGRNVSHLTFDGLYALQHRGQESAGMAVSEGDSLLVMTGMGLVTSVFNEQKLAALPGHMAIGHTRYSTHGSSNVSAAQPVYREVGHAGMALAHNGNLTNTKELAQRTGMLPGMAATDSELVAELVSQACHDEHDDQLEDLRPALRSVLPGVEGAFSIVLLDAGHLYGLRDPNGFRPLCLGRLGSPEAPEGWVLASESPALDVIGADFVREVEPGELIMIDGPGVDGLHSEQLFEPGQVKPKLCIFEFVYFARPDSRLYGQEVHGTRRRMGELLAEQSPVEADMVMGVPDSGVPAAEGYARRSGIPYGQGLVKNRYIGRTFIDPDRQSRVDGVRRKLNPLRENIAGKRLVVVDDSIVRGTTPRAMVRMLRDAGAAEVHLRISSPPFKHSCFYGIDTPTEGELLASRRTIDEICEFLGADSLDYLTLEHLEAAIDAPGAGFCNACMTGQYPVTVRDREGHEEDAGAAPTKVAVGVPGARTPEPALQPALPGV